jgi:hypothetical protein
MHKCISFKLDGKMFSVCIFSGNEVCIFQEGMNGGFLRHMEGEKWKRFDAGHSGVIIVQIGTIGGTQMLEVKREQTEILFLMDLTSTKNV